MTLKGIFGITLLIIYGFAVLITCASVGFVGTQLLMILMPWWNIVGGTLLGTIAVVLHLIVKWEMEDKKK